MKILKLCVAVVSITIALFFCIQLNLDSDKYCEMYSVPAKEVPSIEEAIQSSIDNWEKVLPNEILTTEAPAGTPLPTPISISESTYSQSIDVFAEITIKTDKRNGSYAVMPDVYENTLRHNIGWLPSSSMPGEDGICVFMGHRDTDFRILQYLNTGDEIIVEQQSIKFFYNVYKIEIVNSDSELRFDVLSDSSLVLVTCYPFYYWGHAPKKFVVYSKNAN